MSLWGKVFSFGYSDWNNPRRAKLFAPFFAAVGAIVGSTIHFFWVVHLVDSSMIQDLLGILVISGAVFGAFVLLALFD